MAIKSVKRMRHSESHQRQLVEASDSSYNQQLRPVVNPADGSRGIFQVQPSLSVIDKVGLEQSTHSRGWDSSVVRRLVGRLKLNHPPTSVGGILALASMAYLVQRSVSQFESFVSCCFAELIVMRPKMPSVFISHNHQDKTFVRRLGADRAANGVRPWIDEAEINVGDSLIAKIATAIDEMDHFAIVLSPRSVASAWVQQELEQALTTQLASKRIKILPILLEKCEIPAFLRGKKYADFTQIASYDGSFVLLLKALGIDRPKGEGDLLYDSFAREYGRHGSLYSRPVMWHCIFCGWRCNESFNDYICKSCGRIRPFAGGSATMVQYNSCKQMSLALASFCEWCGTRIGSKDA